MARLSQLDQDIYAAIVWSPHPADAAKLMQTLRGRFEKDPGEANP